MAEKITPRSEDYAQWYVDVVRAAQLADYSPVRGSMIMPPNGYELWERMRDALDGMFKATGHRNAYFPLFIPQSFLAREAEHVEGFAKECAVVTHSRLTVDGNGELAVDPASELEEPLVVRPTSETIIWDTYAKWIKSWRDLPILINQWANVVRWEMRTRLLLRTTEFLWQEGHTAHASEQEAREETARMLDVYATFAEEWMAVPVIRGAKTPSERFAGAIDTLCIEALMQDGKALQAGTSHFLGQNFARAFNCTFQNRDNEQEHVWATSWGVSTRLIGAIVMVHGDDRGLILPPRLAPTQVAIVPIWKSDDERAAVTGASETLAAELREAGVRVIVDAREQYRPGWKFTEYEVQGVPLRIAIGPRDLQSGVVELARRHSGEKSSAPRQDLVATVKAELAAGQKALFDRAVALREANTHAVDDYDDFKAALDAGGFVLAHWDRDEATEARIKEETRATIRCLPFAGQVAGSEEAGVDPLSGKPSPGRVVYARAY